MTGTDWVEDRGQTKMGQAAGSLGPWSPRCDALPQSLGLGLSACPSPVLPHVQVLASALSFEEASKPRKQCLRGKILETTNQTKLQLLQFKAH